MGWRLLDACGAETARTPFRRRKLFTLAKFHACDRRYNHLRNAFATNDDKRISSEIDQNDGDLAPVISVDRAGAIENRHAMFDGKP